MSCRTITSCLVVSLSCGLILTSCFVGWLVVLFCVFVFLVHAQFAVTDDCNLPACTPELLSVPDITI